MPVDGFVPQPAPGLVIRQLKPVTEPVVTPDTKDNAFSDAAPHVMTHTPSPVQLENAGVNVETPIQLGPGFVAAVRAPVAVEVLQMRPLTLPPVAVILNFEPGAVAEKLGPDEKLVDQLVAEAGDDEAIDETRIAPSTAVRTNVLNMRFLLARAVPASVHQPGGDTATAVRTPPDMLRTIPQ